MQYDGLFLRTSLYETRLVKLLLQACAIMHYYTLRKQMHEFALHIQHQIWLIQRLSLFKDNVEYIKMRNMKIKQLYRRKIFHCAMACNNVLFLQ